VSLVVRSELSRLDSVQGLRQPRGRGSLLEMSPPQMMSHSTLQIGRHKLQLITPLVLSAYGTEGTFSLTRPSI
jgi:hypothetical protein